MHLRTLVSGLTDEQMIKAAHVMIEEMERQKAALHPE
jgi:pentatricopeptide repeat protein